MAVDALRAHPPVVVFVGRRNSIVMDGIDSTDPNFQTAGPLFFDLLHQQYHLVEEIECSVPDGRTWQVGASKPDFHCCSSISIWKSKSAATSGVAAEVGAQATRVMAKDIDMDAEKKRAQLCRIITLIATFELEDILLHDADMCELLGKPSRIRSQLRKLWKNLSLPTPPGDFHDIFARRGHLHRHLSTRFAVHGQHAL